jgi:hypothetical protein
VSTASDAGVAAPSIVWPVAASVGDSGAVPAMSSAATAVVSVGRGGAAAGSVPRGASGGAAAADAVLTVDAGFDAACGDGFASVSTQIDSKPDRKSVV